MVVEVSGMSLTTTLLSLAAIWAEWGRGAGLCKALLGSTAAALAAHANVPVLVAGGPNSSQSRGEQLVQGGADAGKGQDAVDDLVEGDSAARHAQLP
jgi:hypothetical protein